MYLRYKIIIKRVTIFLPFFRNVFQQDDIAVNYRDHEGDLIRILDDEDVLLMIKESRGQDGKVKRPVNQFPWELHVTLASDFSVYNTEPWEKIFIIPSSEQWPIDNITDNAVVWFFLQFHSC